MLNFHSSELLATPPASIEYLVDGILPLGTGGDVSGPPGEGKSTILLSLCGAISSGRSWFGMRTKHMPVAWITGEASGRDAIARDLHRLRIDANADISFFTVDQEMFRFDGEAWTTTAEGDAVIEQLRAARIGFVIIDTIGSVCAGLKEIDNDQQRQLARHLRGALAGMTWLTISHTNQASAKDALPWRLHYLSRAGGNGFPGAVRWAAGVAAVTENDYTLPKVKLPDEDRRRRLVGFGVSKHNEMPRAAWTNQHPTIFEIKPDGALVLVIDGREGKNFTPAEQPQFGRKKEEANERPAVCTL